MKAKLAGKKGFIYLPDHQTDICFSSMPIPLFKTYINNCVDVIQINQNYKFVRFVDWPKAKRGKWFFEKIALFEKD